MGWRRSRDWGGAFQYSRRGLRLRDKPLWGLRVQAPFGARVQKVHKGQRGVVAPLIYRRRPLMIKPLQPPCGRWKTGQPPWRAMEMHFPFCGLRHHLPAPLGSVSLDSQSPTAPCEYRSLATAVSVGRQKESAFMGRLGALLRPTCTSYAGCAQWTIKLRKAVLP